MTTVAIIQARTGSSRLPGKVLKRVGKQAILTHVLARAKRIPGIDRVVLTTTDDPADDVLVNLCRGAGVSWTRGQTPLAGQPGRRDVLAGYVVAAAACKADVIVRITSDCPLLDPLVAGDVLAALRAGVAYSSNVHPPSWYDGSDIEAFTRAALVEAHRQAGPDEREHVTTWMHQHLPIMNVRAPHGLDYSGLKLSVDDHRDLERVRRVWEALTDHEDFGWRDVVAAYQRAFPSVAEIRARAVYGGAHPRVTAPLCAAFVAGAASVDILDLDCPYSCRAEESAWRLGRDDAREQGYQ